MIEMDFTKATSVTPGYMRSELDPKNLISHHINKSAGGQDSPAGEWAQIFSELMHTNLSLLQTWIQNFRSWTKISLLLS